MPNSSLSSFKERAEAFIGGLTLEDRADATVEEQKATVRRELVMLVLQIQKGAGASNLTKLSYAWNFKDEFSYFKNQYLDVSGYLHRTLWKKVIRHLNKQGELATGREEADVLFCVSQLTKEQLKRVKGLDLKEQFNLDHVDLSTHKTGMKKKKDIVSYVKSKSPALRFIADNDPGVSLEDFEQDLLCEYLRVWNIYPRSKGTNLALAANDDVITKVAKYVETALNNKVMNIKEYYTCDSRRRVVAVDDDKYKQRDKLKKKMRDHAKATNTTGKLEKKMFGKLTEHEQTLLKVDPQYQDLHGQLSSLDREIRQNGTDFLPLVTSLVKGEEGDAKDIDVADGAQDISFVFDEAVEDKGMKRKELVESLKRCFDRFCGDKLTADHVGIRVQLNLNGQHVWGEVVDGDADFAIIEVRSGDKVDYIDTRDDEFLTVVDISFAPKLKRFVEIILGATDTAFEGWAKDNKLDLDNYETLLRGAKKYLGVTKDDIELSKKMFSSLRD